MSKQSELETFIKHCTVSESPKVEEQWGNFGKALGMRIMADHLLEVAEEWCKEWADSRDHDLLNHLKWYCGKVRGVCCGW